MQIEYDVEKINRILNDFYNATRINIRFVEPNSMSAVCKLSVSNPYCRAIQATADGLNGCRMSDRCLFDKCRTARQSEIHVCHAGLMDAAIPILLEDTIAGYLIMGPMKQNAEFSAAAELIRRYPLNSDDMRCHYDSLPLYDPETIRSIANIALMLTRYILTENMLKPYSSRITEQAVEYIEENLSRRITVHELETTLHLSKSMLYKLFRERFGCTVSEYVNRRRVERSLHFLLNSDMSMEEISQHVGFSDSAYFGKQFKKEKGISPLQFRKQKEGKAVTD